MVFRLSPFRIAVLLGMLLSVLRFTGCHYLELIDVRAVDYRLRQRGPLPPGSDIVIVAVDNASVEAVGRWPWPRPVVAKLLDQLMAAQPAVVGFDIVQSEATQPVSLDRLRERLEDRAWNAVQRAMEEWQSEDEALVAAVQRSGRAVLGYFFESPLMYGPVPASTDGGAAVRVATYNAAQPSRSGVGETRVPLARAAKANLPRLTAVAREVGYFNFIPDDDGSYRRVPLAIRYKGEMAVPLSLAMLRLYRPTEPLSIRFADFGIESVRAGSVSIPVAEDGAMLINYRGPGKTFPHIPAADVLAGRVPPEMLRGKLVLVGVTAAALFDIRVSPFDPILPGVEIHANVLDNILRRDFVQQPKWVVLVEIGVMLLSGLILGLGLHFARGVWGALVAAVLLAAYLVWSQWVFVSLGLALSFVYPLLAIGLTYVAISVQHYVVEEREKRKIRNAFGLYLSPSLAKLVSDRPEMLALGGDKRELTVLFSDIRGFTTISEGLEPEALVHLLNEFLGDMTDVIFAHDGTLDKYIGDAIMAVWGAPVPQENHAARACEAALGMVNRLHTLSTQWKERGLPKLDIGIGLNTGPMVVGNMGSARRLSYTVIGDNVNLGSRLEGLNKLYGTHIIASESTVRAAGAVVVRELDLVRVKGKRLPVRIFELLAVAGEQGNQEWLVERFEAGLHAYRQRRWDEAVAAFGAVLDRHPDDGPARLYLGRIRGMLETPPTPDWDGVTVMESK